MKKQTGHIKELQDLVKSIENVDDITNLINTALSMMYGNRHKPISKNTILYYANHKNSPKRYKRFEIAKKSGGRRTIHAPAGKLKSILRALNFILQAIETPHKAATGFVSGKSIVDNAFAHTKHYYVYNIDLKDYFHSFDLFRVKKVFMFGNFKLNGNKEPLAYLLARLVTHPLEVNGEIKAVLPQGSPASPVITNILSKTLDRRLSGLAKRFGLIYSRYADDITFSSLHNVYKNEEFLNELNRIITEQGFAVNPAKTRLQKTGYRQEVTGLVVNEKVNVRRRYIKRLRNWLYLWERYGYEKAQTCFLKDYKKDKGHIVRHEPNIINVIDGKLEYLKMVKGEKDGTYQKLKARFDKLAGSIDPVNEVLEIWEKEGIDKAMEVFYTIIKPEKTLKTTAD